ncbi:hypothetical protein RIF29_04492 [Crotalaria pallida]|uniref:Uncharacterized protein n=1 Tax=Crotalaria pallida TaxID=3830 RepID=A0AAN9PAE2_CROPI
MVAGWGAVAGSNWVGLGLVRLGDEEGRMKGRHSGVRREIERDATKGGRWVLVGWRLGLFMKGWGEEEAPWRRFEREGWWLWFLVPDSTKSGDVRLQLVVALEELGLRG